MRAYFKREVYIDDLDNYPVRQKELPIKDLLITTIRAWYRSLSLVKMSRDKKYNEQVKERLKKIDDVKIVLSKIVNSELQGKKEITVTLDRNFNEFLTDVVKSAEFLPYEIERIKDNPDFLRCFPDTPIKLRIKVASL